MECKNVANLYAKNIISNLLKNLKLLVNLKQAAVTLIICLLLVEFGVLPQIVQRGFYCDDRSIAMKYNGDTVTTYMLISSVTVPIFLVWITEAIFYSPESARNLVPKKYQNARLNVSWYEAWYWSQKYLRGMIIKLVIVDAIKIFLGELRPHFLDTCKPDALINCTNPSEYITSYVCTNTLESHYFVRDASKSFPSGHASTSVFEAVFMIWYLEKRVPKLKVNFLVPLFQMFIMLWAVLCSISRITDHRHHWWDVLAGFIVGLVASVLTCVFACHNFETTEKETKSVLTNKVDDHKLIPSRIKDEINLNNVNIT